MVVLALTAIADLPPAVTPEMVTKGFAFYQCNYWVKKEQEKPGSWWRGKLGQIPFIPVHELSGTSLERESHFYYIL